MTNRLRAIIRDLRERKRFGGYSNAALVHFWTVTMKEEW